MDIPIIALATLATVLRILVLIAVSILLGWGLAYLSIKSRRFENVYIPLVNAFESIPVIGFLPIVLVAFISGVGGPLGVELAADFLVFDAVVWNIWIGIYQAFKTVPEPLLEVADNYKFGVLRRLKDLYIPHSLPRITSNLFSSFADGLFYISVSEIFTVGVKTYQTFGIGTTIAVFLQQGNLLGVYYSLAFVAAAVIIVTLAFSRLSKRAIAKYGLNTDLPIRRYHSTIRKYIYSTWRNMSRENIVSRFGSRFRSKKRVRYSEREPEPSYLGTVVKYSVYFLLAVVAVYLLFWAYVTATSVSGSEWSSFFSETPFLIYAMGVDYLRVAAIALASALLAITLGYYLAVHKKASTMLTPIIQMIGAFPAPTYFPLIFIATLPFLASALPFEYTEVYIFILGFLSCFYYVLFDFWIGVQAIPSEFWEIMRNHELGFFTRMRYIILPAAFPYLITGLSSTINSAWAGIAIAEYWPNIYGTHSLIANIGMMKFISVNLAEGNIAAAAYISLIFAIVVIIYGLLFTRNLMDLARKKYVIEEGIYAG